MNEIFRFVLSFVISRTNSNNSECRDCHANKIHPESFPHVCNDIFEMKTTPNAVRFCSLVFRNQQMVNGIKTMCWLIEKYSVCNGLSPVLICQNEVAIMGAQSAQMNFGNLEAYKSLSQTHTQPGHGYNHPNAFN